MTNRTCEMIVLPPVARPMICFFLKCKIIIILFQSLVFYVIKKGKTKRKAIDTKLEINKPYALPGDGGVTKTIRTPPWKLSFDHRTSLCVAQIMRMEPI